MPSVKILEKKKQLVSELSEELKTANVGVLVSYVGITVDADTKLRKSLREAGCEYKVIKNTLLSLAFKEVGIDMPEENLKGSTALAISKDDYVSAAKILSEYAENDKSKTFAVKAGFIDGAAVGAADVSALAKLPSKEVLVAQVLGSFNAPIQGFTNVLSGTMRGLVVALNAIAEKQATA